MYGMCMNNISISPFDRKRWIADADDCACKLFGNPSRLRQSLLRSAAPLICNGLAMSTTVNAYLYTFLPRGGLSWGKKGRSAWWNRVGRRHIKFRARNVSRRRKIDLPDGLACRATA